MRVTEKTGKTVEEALKTALKELGAKLEEIEYEVLEEPIKGIFGLLGSKPARIRVKIKDNPVEIAQLFLGQVLLAMKIDVVTEVRQREGYIFISFIGPDLGILIGRRGETLDALQYLVNLVANKHCEERIRIVLDVENYRKRREEALVNLARRLSEKVTRTGLNVVLEPMNPQERRIIHTALQNSIHVYTFSEGDEPYRKVVISLKK